jgi:hypothetical protein
MFYVPGSYYTNLDTKMPTNVYSWESFLVDVKYMGFDTSGNPAVINGLLLNGGVGWEILPNNHVGLYVTNQVNLKVRVRVWYIN